MDAPTIWHRPFTPTPSFPNRGQPPDPYDPRLRLASDLYNRGLTSGLATDDGESVAIQSASYPLPFGQLDVAFDPRDLEWGGRQPPASSRSRRWRSMAWTTATASPGSARPWRRAQPRAN